MRSQVLATTVKISNILGATELVVTGLDGSERLVHIGDIVFAGETVQLPEASAIETASLTADVIPPTNQDIDTEIDAIQQLLLDGGDLEELPETAAGNSEAEGSDSYINIARVGAETIAEAQFDTSGPKAIDLLERDSDNDTATAFSVLTPNDAPVANDDSVNATEDTQFNSVIELDANDTDADSDTLTVVAGTFTTTQGGTIVIAADGSYSYTPAPNFNGTDSVEYTVSDGNLTDTGTLTINVGAVNDAPVANDDSVNATEDTQFNSVIELDANDTDADSDTLTVVAGTFTTTQGGTIVIAADGSYSYTPAPNFNGTDSVEYTVSDGNLTDTGTLTINVGAVNDAPVANDDSVNATEDTQFNSVIELDANDTDVDSDTLTVVAGTFTTTQGGTIVIAADGSYSYTPAPNFNGTDSVEYTVSDGNLTDTGTLTINVGAVNDAPVANDDSVNATEDTQFNSVIELDANDTDADSDTLTVVAGTFTTTQGGTIVIAADGSYSYTPAPNFNGTDSVEYTVSDGNLTDTGTLTINVGAVNDAPVANDDSVNATEDTQFNSVIELDANDTDADSDTLTVVAGTFTTTQGGTIVIAADGSYSYTPAPNFNGTDSVEYTVSDGNLTDTGTLTINVGAVNDAPVANDDSVNATEDTQFNSVIELDANDTDVDSDTLTVVAGTFTTTQGGTIVIAADGSYSYTPAPNFNGTDSVEYTVSDGNLTDTGTLTINVGAVNDAPVANDDSVNATEDTQFNSVIELDANDTDADSDTLTVVAGTFTTTQGGTIVIAADGSYSYTPAPNFNGTDSVEYTVSDGNLTDTGTLTINVGAVNDAPVANDDSVNATEDTQFNSVIELDANDTDADSDTLTVVAGTFTTTQGGTIVIAADGSYSYTPAPNFNGTDSVEYTVSDGNLTDTGTLTINVGAVNDAPVANDDSVNATEDTQFNSVIELDANDTDADSDTLTVVAGTFTTTQGGTIVIAADGSYSYTPAPNFNGTDSVEYTVSDGNLTDTGTLTINVGAVNDAPVANDDSVNATEDTQFNSVIELDANDTDADSDTLTVVAGTFTTTQGGTIVIAADGSYSYTPAPNFNGTDSVEYTVSDGNLTDTGTLTINVGAVNDAPVANDDSVNATEDTQFNSVIELDANDTDADSDTLTVVAGTFTTTQGGTIVIAADGSYSYTPAPNFNGTDSVEYTVSDGNLTDTGTLTINVGAVNDAPVANDDSVNATEDTQFNSVIELDANDTDVDSDTLTVVAGTFTTTQGGTIVIAADGSYSYTPAPNFNGTDSVEYTVSDGNLTDTGTLTINVGAVNDAPVANDDSVNATEDTQFNSVIELDANDTDADSDTLTVVAGTFTTTQGGTIVIAADGSYSYTPAPNFNGTDSVEYTVSDGNLTDTGTLTINVGAVNDAPVANDDSVNATEDTQFNSVIELDANDTDADSDTLTVVAGTFTTTQGGTIVIAADGSYSYTPAPNFNGTDSVEYTVSDGNLTDTGTLTINVGAVNDAPVANDDSVNATEDTQFNSVIELDANDTDVDSDTLTVVAGTFTTTQGGTIVIAADGSYSYTPAPNFNGTDSVEYTVSDGNLTDTGTLTINVGAVNDAPVANDDSVNATEDTQFNSVIELDANDTDADSDTLTVVAGTFTTTQGGTIVIAADGSYSYTPAPNFNGTDSVEYTVSDGNLTDTGTLTINVGAVNDAPVANDDSVNATEDTQFNSVIELDANDTDADSDTLTVVAGTFTTTQGGTIVIAADGSYSYTPAPNFNGTDSVEYTVSDGNLTDTGTLTINVGAVNDAPVANDDSVNATEDTQFNSVIELDANDTDVDSDTLTVVAGTFTTTQGGTIVIAADGSYSYTPAPNFNGTDSVEYTVSDGNLTDTGTLTINVGAVNDAPVANDDSVNATEDTQFNSVIELDANDTDADSDTLTVVAGTFTTTQGGTIVIAADGSYSYTPAPNFNGTDSVEYTVSDGNLTDTGTLTINVGAVNDAPVANDDSVNATEDTQFNSVIELDANDTDADSDTLTVVAGTFTTTQGGTIVIAADGSYSYTPAPNFNGTDSVEYTVSDGNLTDTGTLTINVGAVNDAPVANDDSVNATEDTQFNSVIELDANDTDADSDTLTVVAGTFTTTQGGTIVIAADGSYSYTPAPNFNGTDSVEYTVSDGNLTDTGTLTINVGAVNDAPVANDDSVNATEDTQFNSVIELDANDTDADSDTLTVVAGTFTTTQGGTIVIAADGSYSYTPAPNFNGTDSVEYTVSDGNLTDTGTLTINVGAVNDAPVANDDSVNATEDTQFNSVIELDANDTDADSDTLTVVAGTFTTTQGGTIVIAADGSYSYTPAPNFNGTDSVEYTVSDGNLTDTGTLTINVGAVNDAPVANDDSVNATEDTQFNSVIELDANDTDVDSDTLTVVAGTFTTTQGGTIVIAADGSYSYTPAPNFNGTDSVEYTVSDGNLTDTGTLTINVGAVNDAPVANDDSVNATEDTQFNSVIELDANDTDADSDTLTVVAGTFTTTQGGTIVIAADGSYSYTPAPNFNGTDSVEYTVSDGNLTDTGTLTINVGAVNDAPVANDDSVNATEDTQFNSVIELDANDTDADSDTLTVVAGTFTTTQGGTIVIAADGSYSYTPAPNFNGTDSVEYTVSDGNLTDTGTLTINVGAVNDAPVANDDSVNATEDTQFNSVIELDANDTDVDSDTLTVVAGTFTTTQGGTIVIAADGSYSYTPAPNFNGTDSVEYTVSDGNLTDTGTLTINVGAVNDAPVANDDSVNATEDTQFNSVIELDANDTDADSDTLTVVAGTFTTTQGGTIVIAADGSYSYTPAPNFNGTDSVEYTVSDGNLTDTGTLTINVGAVNDAPVANDDSGLSVAEDGSLELNLLGNDTDIDGDTLSVTSIAGEDLTGAEQTITLNDGSGTVQVAADGTITFVPVANFNGEVSFDYTISDGNGGSGSAKVEITVTPLKDAPIGQPDQFDVVEGASLTLSAAQLVTNDSDVDGDALTVINIASDSSGNGEISAATVGATVTTALGGIVTINADGTYEYTAPASVDHSSGAVTDSFYYQAGDGTDTSAWTRVAIDLGDTAPDANDDTDSIGFGGTAYGNVITGAGTDGSGIDSIGADDTQLQDVSFDNTTYSNWDVQGNLTINTDNGILVINRDGSYSYESTQAESGSQTLSSSDLFSGIGAQLFAYANKTDINITALANTGASVNNSNSVIGVTSPLNNSQIRDSEALVIQLDQAANSVELQLNDMKSNGSETVFWQAYDINNQLVDSGYTNGNDISIAPTSAVHAIVLYQEDARGQNGFTLVDVTINSEQGIPTSDSFDYTLIDADGDTDSATLIVNQDSTPTAINDSGNVAESGLNGGNDEGSGTNTAFGNLLDNDTGISSSTQITSVEGEVAINGIITVTTTYGVLTVHVDDSNGQRAGYYEYELTSPASTDDASETINYTVENGLGESSSANLTIDIIDDAPVVKDISQNLMSDSAPMTTNLSFVLDLSGSMDDPAGNGKSYLETAVESLTALINTVDDTGDVNIQIITFSGSTMGNSTWLLDDIDGAINHLNGLSADDGTRYSTALDTIMGSGPLPVADQSFVYFISDGAPNDGYQVNESQQDAWEAYLDQDGYYDIAFAIGIGDAPLNELLPIAHSKDPNDDNNNYAVVVDDAADLTATVVEYFDNNSIEGELNLLTANGGISIGADGGNIQAVTIDGTTYTYDGNTAELAVTTTLGGLFTLDFVTGTYSYTIDVDRNVLNETESISVDVIDGDGDTDSLLLELHIDYYAGLDANVNNIITNGTEGGSLTLDAAYLTHGDATPEDSQISAVNGDGVSLDNGLITIADGSDGDSFEYVLAGNNTSDSAEVSLDYRDSTKLVGTHENDIIMSHSASATPSMAEITATVRSGDTYRTSNQFGFTVSALAAGLSVAKIEIDLASKDSNAYFDIDDSNLSLGSNSTGIDQASNIFDDMTNDSPVLTANFVAGDFTNGDQFWFSFDTDYLGSDYFGRDYGADLVGVSFTVTLSDGSTMQGTYESDGNSGATARLFDSILDGQAGDDVLIADNGNDLLLGGGGDDLLIGGLGSDILTGGAGSDTFMWQDGDANGGEDVITDFEQFERLELSELLIGATADNIGEYLSVSSDGTNTTINIIDTNGTATGGDSQTIVLQGVDTDLSTLLGEGSLIFADGSDNAGTATAAVSNITPPQQLDTDLP
ncbi:Ig-like domain-containing protein [Ferrimonas lipolytica]|uniref:Tandem-95 repeat protein n=1 Tax=Ferrimonas lipolytica TaxID=2724191 RepID=A0A6H1UHB5_9GAMM|nr:Ig-like domain-containing protein [Ferrimonas lipolytica]QIZ78019.1 tandem-95 repeat protein [Ferrimonas lipolytica]